MVGLCMIEYELLNIKIAIFYGKCAKFTRNEILIFLILFSEEKYNSNKFKNFDLLLY